MPGADWPLAATCRSAQVWSGGLQFLGRRTQHDASQTQRPPADTESAARPPLGARPLRRQAHCLFQFRRVSSGPVPSRPAVCRLVSSSSVVLCPVPSRPVPCRAVPSQLASCRAVLRRNVLCGSRCPSRLGQRSPGGLERRSLTCAVRGGGGGGAESSRGELTGRPARPSSGGGAWTALTSAPPTRRCLSVSDVCVRQEGAVDLHKYQAEPGPGGAARQTGSAHLPGAAGQRPLNGPFVPARPMGETRRRTNERLLSGTSLGDSGHGCIRDARRPGPPPADERNHRCRVRGAETPFPLKQRGLRLSTIFMPPAHTLMLFDGRIQDRLYWMQ